MLLKWGVGVWGKGTRFLKFTDWFPSKNKFINGRPSIDILFLTHVYMFAKKVLKNKECCCLIATINHIDLLFDEI